MLGKLIKYDLKANRNLFLLMYVILLASAIGTRFVIGDVINDLEGYSGLGMIAVFLMMSYMVAAVTVMIMGYVLVIKRFYTHLFCGEGYLTFTLPVTAAQHFSAKVISGLIWQLLSLLVQAVSLLLLFSGALKNELLPEFSDVMLEAYAPLMDMGDIVWQIVFSGLNTVTALMMIYFAICLGQMSRRRRVLSSVIYYFGMSFVFSMIGSVVTEAFINVDILGDVLWSYEAGYYVMSVIVLLLKMIIFGGGSILIMQKKLNLE